MGEHEPECIESFVCLDCGEQPACTCAEARAAYRRGYNDHARSVQHWQDTHGAYRAKPCEDTECWCNRDDVRVALYVQHGEGTNP